MLGGPLVWAGDLQVAYWLVYHACHTNNMVPLYLETAGGHGALRGAVPDLVADAARGFQRRTERAGRPTIARASSRSSGLGLSVMFFIVLVAAAVPRLVLTPCP